MSTWWRDACRCPVVDADGDACLGNVDAYRDDPSKDVCSHCEAHLIVPRCGHGFEYGPRCTSHPEPAIDQAGPR